jgi:Ca-activated chloride channel homolog
MVNRREKHFWYFVALMSAVVLLGIFGQLISCASAQSIDSERRTSYPYGSGQPTAPWNQPGPSVTTSPDVTLSAHIDRGAILQHGDGIVRVELNVTTAYDTDASVERSSDILVVVDTSGSMSGQKLHYARQAILELINRLGEGDRFGLVEYSSYAQVLIPLQYASEGQKHYFRTVANGLSATSNTNMSAGLDQAIAMMLRESSSGRPGRVLLLSDGLANEGDASHYGLTGRARTLSQNNVTLTAIGIGEDFDERLMTDLATAGTGAFYYLSNLGYLAQFFDAELASSRGTFARGAEIRFDPASGVSMVSAMGLPIESRGQTQVVRLGSLYSARTRTVWLTLRAPSHRLGSLSLGHLSVGFERNGRPEVASVGALPTIVCLNDHRKFQDEIRKTVWERALLNDVFTTTEERFGDAIRTGSRQELHTALGQAEASRKLAESLGSKQVIEKLDDLKRKAVSAEHAQAAPAAERNLSAKKSKAQGYQMRNRDVYNDSEAAMKSY